MEVGLLPPNGIVMDFLKENEHRSKAKLDNKEVSLIGTLKFLLPFLIVML